MLNILRITHFVALSLLLQRSWVTWAHKVWYSFFPKVKWYAELAFEAINAMKLWREADDASTPVPEVEDDMNVKIVISSDASELSSAQIQLELETFQLGSSWDSSVNSSKVLLLHGKTVNLEGNSY